MEKTPNPNPNPDPVKPVQAAPPRPVKLREPTSEEMYHALHAMVISAEADGRRDNPAVASAREVLQRHPKHPPVDPAPAPPSERLDHQASQAHDAGLDRRPDRRSPRGEID